MTKNKIRRKNNIERYRDGWIIPVRKGGTYMNATRLKKIFRQWLKENIHRFNHRPYAVNSVHNEYYFEGISKNVTLVMNYNLPEAMIYHKDPQHPNECCNHEVIEYIGDEQYDRQRGYYDSDRTDHNYTYYPAQKELYIHEVFEKIITHTNEKFMETNALYIYRFSHSSSSVIAPKADYEKLKENFRGAGICLCFNGAESEEEEEPEKSLYQYELVEELAIGSTDYYLI